MKHIFKLFLVLIAFSFSACDATDLDLQNDPNEVTSENLELDLIWNRIMLDFAWNANNISGECMPYVRMIAMTGGDLYDNQDRPTSFNNEWADAYSDLFPDLRFTDYFVYLQVKC